METIIKISLAVLLVLFVYSMWNLKRDINYSFGYEDRVHEQVQKMYEKRIQTLESKVQELENAKYAK